MMKRITILLAMFALVISMCAQDVTFRFTNNTIVGHNGQNFATAKVENIGRNISALLTTIHRAHTTGAPLALASINMTQEAKKDLMYDWQRYHISCDESQYTSNAVCDADGFQVRGIQVTFQPNGNYTGDRARELFICFDNNGVITEVGFAMATQSVNRIMADKSSVVDEERRYTILKFVENFRQCYERKDIEGLRRIYSDNALIITGRVVKETKQTIGEKTEIKNKIVYSKQDKEQYLTRMAAKFRRERYINVDFDDFEIEQCAKQGYTNFYGVTFIQHWKDSSYEDEGHLFLLWEFPEDGDPLVHVRTWQPLHVGDHELSDGERISMGDYKF